MQFGVLSYDLTNFLILVAKIRYLENSLITHLVCRELVFVRRFVQYSLSLDMTWNGFDSAIICTAFNVTNQLTVVGKFTKDKKNNKKFLIHFTHQIIRSEFNLKIQAHFKFISHLCFHPLPPVGCLPFKAAVLAGQFVKSHLVFLTDWVSSELFCLKESTSRVCPSSLFWDLEV